MRTRSEAHTHSDTRMYARTLEDTRVHTVVHMCVDVYPLADICTLLQVHTLTARLYTLGIHFYRRTLMETHMYMRTHTDRRTHKGGLLYKHSHNYGYAHTRLCTHKHIH